MGQGTPSAGTVPAGAGTVFVPVPWRCLFIPKLSRPQKQSSSTVWFEVPGSFALLTIICLHPEESPFRLHQLEYSLRFVTATLADPCKVQALSNLHRVLQLKQGNTLLAYWMGSGGESLKRSSKIYEGSARKAILWRTIQQDKLLRGVKC